MSSSVTGSTLAATFADGDHAQACLNELKGAGFHSPWMALTKPAPTQERGTSGEADSGTAHAVAAASDGVFGAIGRYFNGELSLRRSLVDHGLSERDAAEIDDSLPDLGAVVVVRAGDRVDDAASILSRGAAKVIGAEGERFARYPSSTDTVPGQGDELDRGSDRGRSGGGLGATTGFWKESDARKDMHANEIGELGEGGADGAQVTPVYYERSDRQRS